MKGVRKSRLQNTINIYNTCNYAEGHVYSLYEQYTWHKSVTPQEITQSRSFAFVYKYSHCSWDESNQPRFTNSYRTCISFITMIFKVLLFVAFSAYVIDQGEHFDKNANVDNKFKILLPLSYKIKYDPNLFFFSRLFFIVKL